MGHFLFHGDEFAWNTDQGDSQTVKSYRTHFIQLMEQQWSLEDWLSETHFPAHLFSNDPPSTWSTFPDDDAARLFGSPGDLMPFLEPKVFLEPIISAMTGESDHNLIRRPISAHARCEMNQWVIEYASNPFLSNENKEYFMKKYELTRRQVSTAFNNRLPRIIASSVRKHSSATSNSSSRFNSPPLECIPRLVGSDVELTQ
jgi:hypothetical protein